MGEPNTRNLIITNTVVNEDSYNVSLSCPRKTTLEELLVEPSDRISTEVTFVNGLLASVPHSIQLHLFLDDGGNPNIGLYIRIEPKPNDIVKIASIFAKFIGDDDDSTSNEGTLYPSRRPLGFELEDYEYYEYNCNWPESTVMVYLTLRFSRRGFPSLIEDCEIIEETQTTNGTIETGPLFLSDEFSDVLINDVFPAHRLILACKSEYFRAMFRVPFKESIESRIKIEDMESRVLKEFLRFIYCGSVDDDVLSDCVFELYAAADKYNVEGLLLICEQKLLRHMDAENVLHIYDLCHGRPDSKLCRRAKEILAGNKSRIAEDAESFKNFTCKYPELIFEIFKLS